jgi:hypothetical protein
MENVWLFIQKQKQKTERVPHKKKKKQVAQKSLVDNKLVSTVTQEKRQMELKAAAKTLASTTIFLVFGKMMYRSGALYACVCLNAGAA